jgi:Zn finger protein HypA/HybF involved in hydrogenase expression
MEGVRSGGVSLRTTCNRCGQPLPLNAPVRRATCAACSADVTLPDGIWTCALDELEMSYESLAEDAPRTHTATIDGFPLTFEVRRAVPRCEKCGQAYPDDRMGDGSTRDLFCVGCGDPGSTYPAPDWLRSLVPTAVQIVSTDRGGAAEAGLVSGGGGAAAAPTQASVPVVMSCPQCGGPLRITDDMARLVPCTHCHAEVYLPDELWRRLHPAKVSRLWYVRFEGKSRWMVAKEQAERDRLAEEARAEADAVARRRQQERLLVLDAEEGKLRDEDVARLVSQAFVSAIVAGVALLATSVWALVTASMSDLAQIHTSVGVALVVTSAICLIVALAMAGMPIKRRTGYSGDALLFVVWFFAIFGFVMPVVGQIMCLVVGIKRFGGKVGGSMGQINDVPVSAPIVQLHGESVPLAIVYLELALLWPLAIASVASTA